MPSLDYGLYTILTGSAPLALLVGTRITPERRIKNSVLPALVYRVGFSTPYMTLEGKFANLSKASVDMIAYGYTRTGSAEITNTIATLFSSFVPGIYGGVDIRGIEIQSVSGSYADAIAGESQGVFIATLETQIYFDGF